MAGHAIEAREAREPEKRSYRKVHHLEVEKVGDIGHKVTTHYHSDGMNYHKPTEKHFGEGEGQEMVAHVAKSMGVPIEAEAEEPEDE